MQRSYFLRLCSRIAVHCARPARRSAETKAYLDSVCAMLKDGSTSVPVPVKGSSMVPFFREGDTVYLDSVPPKLHVGDIVLYTRVAGDYILHRIVSVSSNGRFTILGDAQLMKSAENVSGKCIKAIVTSACRGGKHQTSSSFSWKAFSFILSHTARVRRFPNVDIENYILSGC